MANELAFKPGRIARIKRGRYQDQEAELVSEDQEQAGFWWCKVHDRTAAGKLVLREKLISHGQLRVIREGSG